jgi:hypothetical protein
LARTPGACLSRSSQRRTAKPRIAAKEPSDGGTERAARSVPFAAIADRLLTFATMLSEPKYWADASLTAFKSKQPDHAGDFVASGANP